MQHINLIKSILENDLGKKYKTECDKGLLEAFKNNRETYCYTIGGIAVSTVYAMLKSYKDGGFDVELIDFKLKFTLYDPLFLQKHYLDIKSNNERLKNKIARI